MDYLEWYKKWNDTKSFIVENDRLKKKKYYFTSFPIANKYGFQDGDIRRIITSDVLARYSRLNECNVLFPVGFNSLSNSAYLENRKISNAINDDISNIFYKEMQMLGIGINDNKCIDTRHNEYLANLQQLFIDLYNRGYIEYKPISVFFDKKNNKIYDTKAYDLELPQQVMKCFVLNISNLIPQIVLDIKALKCSVDLKNKLISFFKPKVSLKLSIGLTNGTSIETVLNEPEYLGGVCFMFLNPEKMNIRDYVDPIEIDAVNHYLEYNDSLYIYSGIQAINPLTGKKIPVFISRMFGTDVYLGIPGVDDEVKSLADEAGIVYDEILDNGVLINSDFIDGLTLKAAHEKIIDSFFEYDMGEKVFSYGHTEINLSSIDNFGPLFPFLVDKRDETINSLEGHLPYTFSSKLRPTLEEDVDIVGNTLNGTINSLFIEAATPFLCAIHDEMGSVESVFDKRSIDDLIDWLPIEYLPFNSSYTDTQIVMPIILNNIIKKEMGYSIPSIFDRIEEVNDTLDIVERKLERSNNNLLSIEELVKSYSSDTIRLFSALTPLSNNLIVDYDLLDQINNVLLMLRNNLSNLLDADSNDLDYKVYSLHSRCTNLLENDDVIAYANEVYRFLKIYGIKNDLTAKQAKLILKICYPLIPFTAEELYETKLDGKYYLASADWTDI